MLTWETTEATEILDIHISSFPLTVYDANFEFILIIVAFRKYNISGLNLW
jgi:hypothetical protein